jgi:hypothetical protein
MNLQKHTVDSEMRGSLCAKANRAVDSGTVRCRYRRRHGTAMRQSVELRSICTMRGVGQFATIAPEKGGLSDDALRNRLASFCRLYVHTLPGFDFIGVGVPAAQFGLPPPLGLFWEK